MKNCIKSVAFHGSWVLVAGSVLAFVSPMIRANIATVWGKDSIQYELLSPWLNAAEGLGKLGQYGGGAGAIAGTFKRLTPGGDLYSHPKWPGQNKPSAGTEIKQTLTFDGQIEAFKPRQDDSPNDFSIKL